MSSKNIFEIYEEIGDDLKFIASSDIKSKIIISLKEGQKKLSDLKDEVHMNSSTVLHSMSQLESRGLIIREFQGYSLSQTGEMVALNFISVINSLSLAKKNKDFWLNCDLSVIPHDLINELSNLKEYKIEPLFTNLREYNELLDGSKYLKIIIPSLNFFDVFSKSYNENLDIDLILNENLENLIKKSYSESNRIISAENLRLWKTNSKLALIITNQFMLLNLPLNNGKCNDDFLVSKSKEGIKWGDKLFNHYLSQVK
ncbi:helix-turn-helix transcriptional regulator [Methanobacterium oryzae]|uniref:helix-turn-helix transcriptional regulator n=1 Tax=Methanobacterium oryzae TaxID=69540 RepID=UPI003D1C8B50